MDIEVVRDESDNADDFPWARKPDERASAQPAHRGLEENRQVASSSYGRKLAPLREQGILILGSGNLVHNLHTYAWGQHLPEPYDWAVRFEKMVKELLLAGDYEPLIDHEKLGADALLSVPTPDHYLPLLYVVAGRGESEVVTFPVEGVDGGSISMLAVRIG